MILIHKFQFFIIFALGKSAKSKKEQQEDAKSTKSNVTDENNTSDAGATIPLDDDPQKSNGDLSTKSDSGNIY